MENQTAADALIRDIEANLLPFQIGASFLTIFLALVGLTLALRAYTVLSEARTLYWETIKSAAAPSKTPQHAKRAAAIRAAQSSKRVKPKKNRIVL
ncbi:hypothetical protein [Hyphococcus sp.]|uniref:hypothetical protein n=1 Tax=Hyphococcus sp. TaxID=2038636 RepID=UPI003CCBCC6B